MRVFCRPPNSCFVSALKTLHSGHSELIGDQQNVWLHTDKNKTTQREKEREEEQNAINKIQQGSGQTFSPTFRLPTMVVEENTLYNDSPGGVFTMA